MSHVLRKALKPVIDFDPENKEHRRLFYTFLKTHSWAHCPYVFSVYGQYNDLVRMISTQLLEKYMSREFEKTVEVKNDQDVRCFCVCLCSSVAISYHVAANDRKREMAIGKDVDLFWFCAMITTTILMIIVLVF